ncbi:MAG: hypothetical protein J2P31_12910 [Blastocatellia bacterium]|nr:hypothetical protein [Blastocatellia bacterium]
MYTNSQLSTLDEVLEFGEELEGVTLETLSPCDIIHVRTCNSDYEIFLLDPESGRALVKGGKLFALPMEVTVSGSTFGGSMLKLGWLCEGLPMELNANGQRILTSPVQNLRIEHQSARATDYRLPTTDYQSRSDR